MSAKRDQPELAAPQLGHEEILLFRRKLSAWYRRHARVLPWRTKVEPYSTWLSEIMLQQTRVNAVVDHFHRFLENFPTMFALALADEDAVLAAWSGLGYYRRARMLHRAAKFVVEEHEGELPSTAAELRRLPGIGEYTSSAIASIAFGQCIAVVDGNVERVLLRIAGRPEDRSASGRTLITQQAQALVPARKPGDHNQAMMELGATVCLPRGPLCVVCPVYELCRTRGEHVTAPRKKLLSRLIRYGLVQRTRRGEPQVLLYRRAKTESLMPNMYELAPIEDAPVGEEPALRLRHSITSTNYYVEVFTFRSETFSGDGLTWMSTSALHRLPLTGLARKILERTNVMPPALRLLEKETK